jgi:hypothetical protein
MALSPLVLMSKRPLGGGVYDTPQVQYAKLVSSRLLLTHACCLLTFNYRPILPTPDVQAYPTVKMLCRIDDNFCTGHIANSTTGSLQHVLLTLPQILYEALIRPFAAAFLPSLSLTIFGTQF